MIKTDPLSLSLSLSLSIISIIHTGQIIPKCKECKLLGLDVNKVDCKNHGNPLAIAEANAKMYAMFSKIKGFKPP